MIAFDELDLTDTKTDMIIMASLLGYNMTELEIEPLPKIDKRQMGEVLYWKAKMNDSPVGNRIGYIEGATIEGIKQTLIQSVAWMITSHQRPERDLIGQVIVAYPYSQGDLLQAAIAIRVIDYIDKVPQGVLIPGSKKIYEDVIKDISTRLSNTILTLRAIAISARNEN